MIAALDMPTRMRARPACHVGILARTRHTLPVTLHAAGCFTRAHTREAPRHWAVRRVCRETGPQET